MLAENCTLHASPTALAYSIKFCKGDMPRDLVTTWRFLLLPEQVACYTTDRTSILLGAVEHTKALGKHEKTDASDSHKI